MAECKDCLYNRETCTGQFDMLKNAVRSLPTGGIQYKAQEVYFSSGEGAERAIKEVVEPFVKEHPKFKW